MEQLTASANWLRVNVTIIIVKKVWLPVCPLFRSKIILKSPFGSEQSSVIENWEVVRSSEAHDVLKLC